MRIENKLTLKQQPVFSSKRNGNPYQPPAYNPPPKKKREKLKLFLLMLGVSTAIFAPGEIKGCVTRWQQRKSVNNVPTTPGANSGPAQRTLPTDPAKSSETIRLF